jgi:outer membrane protein OmpA-like peptidoglycan-associated protein
VKITRLFLPSLLALGVSVLAMPPPSNAQSSDAAPQQKTKVVTTTTQTTTTFHVTVVSRTVMAVNYHHRGGATKVDFAGTNLMPAATGEAKVESKKGYIEIEVEFANLAKPTAFGSEYLTYVMWAISPEGRAVNLGEVLVGDNDRSKLNVTTDLQAFALVVTAEPYYAVRQPSNVVVMENVIREDTKGTTEAVSAKYELLERGGYIPTGYKFDPVVLNANLPLEFFEARNALRIAESVGAKTYATSSYEHAVSLMDKADAAATSKHVDKKELIAISREAVQTAEDAREIAVKQLIAEHHSNELQASAQAADDATQQKELAEAKAAKAKSDMELSQAKSATDVAEAQAETARANAQMRTAETDKAAMRTKLSIQLNTILATRDTARGLIVSMSDVLFDTGKYTLLPGAREKLSKVAGILIAYPGLNIAVGGYTDNVGTDQLNQGLSEQRAGSVRDYLVQQGVAMNSITAIGYGNTMPVASNDSSAGRQENRRVELVVSGESIGNEANITTGSLR